MTSRICDELGDAELNVTAAFLADYAALLSGCGATCIRIERNTRRMAESFGTAFDIVIMLFAVQPGAARVSASMPG